MMEWDAALTSVAVTSFLADYGDTRQWSLHAAWMHHSVTHKS